MSTEAAPTEVMPPKEYAAIEACWERMYHRKVQAIYTMSLKELTQWVTSRVDGEDDPDTLDAEITGALAIFCITEKHTKTWWEWLTIINGSLKARYVCMCITDEVYWKKQKDFIPTVKNCNAQNPKKRRRVMEPKKRRSVMAKAATV